MAGHSGIDITNSTSTTANETADITESSERSQQPVEPEECGVEVKGSTNEESVLARLAQNVEVASDTLEDESFNTQGGDTRAVESRSQTEPKPLKRHRTPQVAMKVSVEKILQSLEEETVILARKLHEMCELCSQGLDLHKSTQEDLHTTVDKCIKSYYTFMAKLNELENHASCLVHLEGEIKSVKIKLNELENLIETPQSSKSN